MTIGEVILDGTASGTMAILVPSADVATGTLTLSSILAGDNYFVAVA